MGTQCLEVRSSSEGHDVCSPPVRFYPQWRIRQLNISTCIMAVALSTLTAYKSVLARFAPTGGTALLHHDRWDSLKPHIARFLAWSRQSDRLPMKSAARAALAVAAVSTVDLSNRGL
jgi:hypothetical protein